MLALLLAAGCVQAPVSTGGDKKISVVCTVFPQYDWVRQIVGNKANDMEITFLLDDRLDLHSYLPTVEDLVKISTCDLFIYVGGESDEWAEDALRDADNKDMLVISLLDELGDAAKEEEVKEGMEEEEEEEEDEDDDEEEGPEYDEHVWLSLKNAKIFCAVITDALSSLAPGNAKEYQSNLAAYTEKLSALDAEYQAAADAADVKTLVFGDRFPFRYLTDDYGLDYYAAFVGCSAETEASFETIVFLAKKVDELGLNTVMSIESSDGSIAETIVKTTADKNGQILVLDSMQSVTASEAKSATYLSIMESNLDVLKEALK
jgi:zinc transport system substrate-binding protein